MPTKKNSSLPSLPGAREIVTSEGRSLTYREISPWELIKLNTVLGADRSLIVAVARHASLAAGVRQIDGVPRMFPHDEQSLESAVNALGFDGLAAIAEADAKKTEQEVLDAAGESQPTQD